MSNWRKRRTPIIIILIIAAVVVALYAIQPEICNSLSAKKLIDQGNALNCYEFWFNRYQSAISTLLAVIITIFVARYTLRQELQAARKGEYAEAIGVLNKVSYRVYDYSNEKDEKTRQEIRDEIYEEFNEFQTLMQKSGFVSWDILKGVSNNTSNLLNEIERHFICLNVRKPENLSERWYSIVKPVQEMSPFK